MILCVTQQKDRFQWWNLIKPSNWSCLVKVIVGLKIKVDESFKCKCVWRQSFIDFKWIFFERRKNAFEWLTVSKGIDSPWAIVMSAASHPMPQSPTFFNQKFINFQLIVFCITIDVPVDFHFRKIEDYWLRVVAIFHSPLALLTFPIDAYFMNFQTNQEFAQKTQSINWFNLFLSSHNLSRKEVRRRAVQIHFTGSVFLSGTVVHFLLEVFELISKKFWQTISDFTIDLFKL